MLFSVILSKNNRPLVRLVDFVDNVRIEENVPIVVNQFSGICVYRFGISIVVVLVSACIVKKGVEFRVNCGQIVRDY